MTSHYRASIELTRAIKDGSRIARAQQHDLVTTEHFVTAILANSQAVCNARTLFEHHEVTLGRVVDYFWPGADVCDFVLRNHQGGTGCDLPRLPLSPRFNAALGHGAIQASLNGHTYLATDYGLFGVILEGHSRAAEFIDEHIGTARDLGMRLSEAYGIGYFSAEVGVS